MAKNINKNTLVNFIENEIDRDMDALNKFIGYFENHVKNFKGAKERNLRCALAHKMKPSAQLFGAEELFSLLCDLDQMRFTNNFDEFNSVVEKVIMLLDPTLSEIKNNIAIYKISAVA